MSAKTPKVKAEANGNKKEQPKKVVADESEESSEEETTKATPKATPAKGAAKATPKATPAKATPKATPAKAAAKPAAKEESEEDSEESEEEKPKAKANGEKRKAQDQGEEDTKKAKTEGTRIYISNLVFSIDEDTIKEAFKDVGVITAVDWVTDKMSGKFYGSGFLEFETPEMANKALTLNGQDVMGRAIRVELPREKAPREKPTKVPSIDKPSIPKPEGCTSIFIGGLPFDVTDDTVREFLKGCGEISEIRWVNDKATGNFKGCGFIEFTDSSATDKAVALNGSDIGGRSIRIDFAGPKAAPGERKERGAAGVFRGGRGGGRGGRGGRGGAQNNRKKW